MQPQQLLELSESSFGIFVFGPNGIFEKWKREAKTFRLPPGQTLVLSITERALINSNVETAFKGLMASALRTGVERVEIQIADSIPVTIASRSERRGFGKAALHYSRIDTRRNPTSIARIGGEQPALARYKNKEFRSFLAAPAPHQSESVVVLWGSTLPVPGPNDGAVDVQSMIVDDPGNVEFIDDAPLSFDDASYVIVVSASKAGWV